MFATTQAVCGAVFGTGRGDWALLAMPVLPAAVLADGVAGAVSAVRAGLSWARRAAARVLRTAAQALDPVPERAAWDNYDAGLCDGYSQGRAEAARVQAPAPGEAPAVLVMASAAQDTAPVVQERSPEYLATWLQAHGSLRAAARAWGVSESTFRGWCRKAGVATGRKAKG